MTKTAAAIATIPAELRRRALLDAAVGTFTRFGYRKTSMDELARAAHLSRQGLYLQYPNKEELFRAAVRHALESGLEAAGAQLRDSELGIEQKLAGAFDAWLGRYVGSVGADVTDLHEASELLVGPLFAESEAQFVELVTKAIRASGLPAAYKSAGLSARQLAETLSATGRGLKHSCSSRADFGERFGVALRVLCMPVRERE